MTAELWIPETMPSLNDLLRAVMRSPFYYRKVKLEWARKIGWYAEEQGFEPYGSYWTYLFLEPDSKPLRDRANVSGAAIKFIEDGLVESGFMRDDGPAYVAQTRPHVVQTSEHPGIYVVAAQYTIEQEQMEALLKENEAWKKSNDRYHLDSSYASKSRARSSISSRSSKPKKTEKPSWSRSGRLSTLEGLPPYLQQQIRAKRRSPK